MRLGNVIGSAGVLVLVAAATAFGSWSGASGDQYISYIGATGSAIYAPDFAAGPQGQLYCAWVQRVRVSPPLWEVFFSKSTDGGQTWSGTAGDVQINALDFETVYTGGIAWTRRIDMAVDSDGRIFVVWPEWYVTANFDSTIEIMVLISTDGGNTWIHGDQDFPVSDTTSISNSTYPASMPACAIDHNDVIHVVWTQRHPVSGKGDVYYSRSTDHGLTWSGRVADRCIGVPDSTAAKPDIKVGPDNKLHVIWQEKDSDGLWKIHYSVSTDGGNTFSSQVADRPVSTGFTTSNDGNPHLAVSNTGGIHVIYCIVDSVFYVGSTDGGNTWNNVRITTGTGYDFHVQEIAVTSTGALVAIIDDEYPGLPETIGLFALYSFDNGLTWSTQRDPITFYDGGTYDRSYIPNVVVTAGDTLHAVYYTNYPSSSNSYQEMAYSRSDTLATAGPPPGFVLGHVKEQDNTTPIPNVVVTAKDNFNLPVAVDTTDASGFYGFSLAPGTYSNSFHKAGYRDTTLAGIVVVSDDTTYVTMLLQVGAECVYVPGDINGDDLVRGGDVTYGVRFFKGLGGPPPDSCFMDSTGTYLYVAGDVNGNCEFRGSDITRLVAYFKGVATLSYCHFFPPPMRGRSEGVAGKALKRE